MERLYDKLVRYSKQDCYPMHMPGHKRNSELLSMVNPYKIDITEIEGFDNLHHPEYILKDLSERIAKLFGAEKSYPLVNGSTSGILAGISAVTHRGDKILLSRNSHKSVYHAVILNDLRPYYIAPKIISGMHIQGGIIPEEVEEMLVKHPDITLVVITSPTYEGVVSDVEKIAQVVHEHGATLLVDEAHGAHFGFHEGFPQSALKKGADIVIQSIHKTLPSFTQTAILHSNNLAKNDQIEKYLEMYQSSSPSYLLLAGIDQCISILEEKSHALFAEYYKLLNLFYKSVENLKNIKLLHRDIIGKNGVYDLDRSKLTILIKGITLTGHQLSKILREDYHIIMEMEATDYILGMTSICDSHRGLDRLGKALLNIDMEAIKVAENQIENVIDYYQPEQIISPTAALEQRSEFVKFSDSCGKVSCTFVSLFPPGSPMLVPGELINNQIIYYITQAQELGLTITGITGKDKDTIEVICDTKD